MSSWTCNYPGCGKNTPYTDWDRCEAHNGKPLPHSTRTSMPVLGTAARIIDVLDALLELGHGDVTMFASDVPCAPEVVASWASLHGLETRVSELDVLRVERKGSQTLASVHR